MTDHRLNLEIINWNIGGAKYLELPKTACKIDSSIDSPHLCRDAFQKKLLTALKRLFDVEPHIFTMQEVIQYEENGDYRKPNEIFGDLFDKIKKKYNYFYVPLIDNRNYSAQAKWYKVKKEAGWGDSAYFSQGNAIFVRKDIPLFPIWDIPKIGITPKEYYQKKNIPFLSFEEKGQLNYIQKASEVNYVYKGLYFSDRNTEPRAAITTHIVINNSTGVFNVKLKKPLDIFIINLHLTTLTGEREGIPERDKKASNKRLTQLDQIFDEVISPYNSWCGEKKYKLREEQFPLNDEIETVERHKPIWILAGDFNITPHSLEYEYIIRNNYLDMLKDHDTHTKSTGLGRPPSLTLDYVFAGPLYYSLEPNYARLELKSNRVKDDEIYRVSDHMPIKATIPIQITEE